MIDFKKLNDPQWKAQYQAMDLARKQEMERQAEADHKLLDGLESVLEQLSSKERSLVRSVRARDFMSDAQRAWLQDIAKRFPPDLTRVA